MSYRDNHDSRAAQFHIDLGTSGSPALGDLPSSRDIKLSTSYSPSTFRSFQGNSLTKV